MPQAIVRPAATPKSTPRATLWTKRDQAKVCSYVRDVADELGLRDWTFRIEFEASAAPDSIAQIAPTFGQRDAVLMLSAEFAWASPSFQRATVCHELIHCLLAPITEAYQAALTEAGGERAAAIVEEAVTPAVEVATDTLALAVASKLPLPQFGTPKVPRPEPYPPATVVAPRRR